MHVIIMGAGRTGSLLATKLGDAGHDVTLIDWNEGSLGRLPDHYRGRTVKGNAMDYDVLKAAGIEAADAFVAATSGDNRNIMASQIAQHVFNVPRVICRIKDPIRASIYQQLGLEVDCRTVAGSDLILGLMGEA